MGKNAYILLSIIVVLLTIFSTTIPLLKDFQRLAVWVMLAFLGAGLIAYLFDSGRLILINFACCFILCIFLKSASNSNLKLPEVNNEIGVSIAHVNLSSAVDSYEAFTYELLERNLDIISLQEVKPDWSRYLKEKFSAIYPYFIENVRIDPFGMAIYSKFPISAVDTLFYENIPFLLADINLNDQRSVKVMNTMLLPSINQQMDVTQQGQINFAQDYLKEIEGTELVVGDFNMVYWSNRIRDFRNNANLLNSRRDVSQSVLSIPYDHIFHTPDLECTMFKDLVDTSGHRLGIYANFQFFTSLKEEL